MARVSTRRGRSRAKAAPGPGESTEELRRLADRLGYQFVDDLAEYADRSRRLGARARCAVRRHRAVPSVSPAT